MAKMNPIEQSKFIESEYRQYIKSTFGFSDEVYQKMFIDEINKATLYKGPYIKATLPFKKGKALKDLISLNIASSEFYKLESVDLNRKLYIHQEEAFKKISSGENVVITTGTGSGKTESFLYPIINSILKEIESGNNPKGIRAIFLYPMNALVNDQIERLRKVLSGYPQIKYGFFTGDTEEKKNLQTYRSELEKLNDCVIPENELITREQIREEIPHLLFTNYSMLEYLLIRPNDYVLLNKEMLNNWRYVVLDEAHTYKGALGIEVAMLLRRLSSMAIKKPQFILTSATLGNQGESEDDIVTFAENLTTSKFKKECIIFSSREELDKEKIAYRVKLDDYIELDENNNDIGVVKSICEKYVPDCSDDINECLYYLLEKDENIYRLFDVLKKHQNFEEVLKVLYDFNEKQLVSLIHIINIARSKDLTLYELKYHTFVRALAGSYITLGDNKKLKLSNCSFIEQKRAFEVGNCRFCNTPFIMGKICGDDILYQNRDVDIYENYDEEIKNISIDCFLMKESLKDIEIDTEKYKEYEICSKCGKIHDITELTFKDCDCGKEYKVALFKVESSELKNNISECPCCRHHSNLGIIRSLNLGKDEATALLGQILYQAIDDFEIGIENTEKNEEVKTLSFDKKKIEEEKRIVSKKAKQYLAFSDSRQQASFFATFFEDNFQRMLRYRILWECLEINNHEKIPVNQLVVSLKKIIEKYELFQEDNLDSTKEAWITILRELLKIDGKYDGESLGLFYFKLNIDDIKEKLSDDTITEHFEKYNLNPKNFYDFVFQVFQSIRKIPAINYDESTLNREERKEYLEYRSFENYSKLQKTKKSDEKNIHSFLPVNNEPNDILDYTMRVCKCSADEAKLVLSDIYNVIGIQGNLLKKNSKFFDEAYQINCQRYELCSSKKANVYKCNKCGTVTMYNVNDVCITKKCDGKLVIFDPNVEFERNYYRKEYMTKKIEPMVIKEHTAQLTRRQGKEYQLGFKNGTINILSSSTTFEMGVDIGSLETVFMRNVPPSPANYVQRAGRAGRSLDSSAFILTFCNNASHDYTYFDNPTKMIDGIIAPPKFEVTNDKIIIRHLLAASLGFFFRRNVDLFKETGKLIQCDGIKKVIDYIEEKPDDLNKYINSLLDERIYEHYCDYKWYQIMKEKYDLLNNFNNEIHRLNQEYIKGIEEAKKNNDFKQAQYYNAQIENILNSSLIKDLTRYGVIPKYGFPVDTVNLKIYNNGIINNKYDLNRDLLIAISEYAPESEITVDKEKYTSRYIVMPKNKEFKRYYYFDCEHCGRTNIVDTISKYEFCKYCDSKTEIKHLSYFIEPSYGFRTGANKQSRRKKPKKTYAGEKIYLGNSDLIDYSYDLNDRVRIETSSDDELLVMNTNPFFICQACGYCEIDKKNYCSHVIKKEHKNFREFACENKDLDRISLGHIFKTDVAKIIISNFNDKKVALSTLYALLEGISFAFNIERTDIDGLLVCDSEFCYNLILYDNVPGGAGHIKRLKEKKAFEKALEYGMMKVEQECCDERTSCYNCLRSYYNQRQHEYLSRRSAKIGLKYIMKEDE